MTDLSARETVGWDDRSGTAAVVARYEAMGYRVDQQPAATDLPPFFGNYRPDLIVSPPDEPGRKIVIEVLRPGRGAGGPGLEELKKRFEGQDGWEFRIALAPHDPDAGIRLPVATKPQLEAELATVASLEMEAGTRPAFLMAFALLEAASHAVPQGSSLKPRKPVTTIRTLGALGLIEPEDEDRLIALVPLRNRIVHGEIAVVPTSADVALILSAVRKVLAAL